ncbi:uncharacterized protein LOC120313319 isoform X3 [Crotalus tigris]|uniref:uncharacterized protein LOC120313319 isoform X3 n=1 Tax=Crotalus tigris TaxID=88082 RepID=UPI00192F4660|nr:uncharacterized protein LOC120313319 isoform X3 [Crotalus tigris]
MKINTSVPWNLASPEFLAQGTSLLRSIWTLSLSSGVLATHLYRYPKCAPECFAHVSYSGNQECLEGEGKIPVTDGYHYSGLGW